MPANTKPIFPLTPVIKQLSLAAVTACTTRAPVATANLASSNIFLLSDTSTNGRKIDAIEVNGGSTSITSATTAGLVQIWIWDGTNAYLYDEISVSAVTPSTTTAGFSIKKSYTDLVLPATHRLYASSTITTTASTNALVVTIFGGDY